MEKIEFQVETVTPLLLSGADKRTAELRPGQIEKQIRWWWRWARGPKILEPDNHEEADIFGSTDGASRVIVRIKGFDQPRGGKPMALSDLLSEFGDSKYLSYVFFPYRTGDAARGVVLPGTTFRLSIMFVPGLSVEQRNQVLAALWLFFFLGGVGARNRRGIGSLRVKGVTSNTIVRENDPHRLVLESGWMLPEDGLCEQYVSSGLKHVISTFGTELVDPAPSFTCLSRQSRIFLLNRDETSWQSALIAGMKILYDFRYYKEGDSVKPRYLDDYGSIKSFLKKKQIPERLTYSKAALGLPIEVNFKDCKDGHVRIKGRRSSPIFFKVLQHGCSERSYRTIVGVFPAIFKDGDLEAQRMLMEKGAKSKRFRKPKPHDQPARIEPPSLKILNEFAEYVLASNATEILTGAFPATNR